jgi:hypothetical protein
MIDRLMEAERLIMDLRARVGSLEQRVTEVGQSTGSLWSGQTGGGSGGGQAGTYYCNSPINIPGQTPLPSVAIYTQYAGIGVVPVETATIFNPYISATTAGRLCTLVRNSDGSYWIYGQSCT